MSAFKQLCPALQNWMVGRGWKRLRRIQELSFSPINAGQHVLLIAPTAGGKTEAAMLPLLNRWKNSPIDGVKILYIAPLKALINNLEKRFIETRICDSVYLRVAKWHGDVARSRKLSISKQIPDILLTTPESLDVILYSPYINKLEFFAPLDAVIIDETHYFAGSERGGQLIAAISRIEKVLSREIQRICLSATVGNPQQVLSWMCEPSTRARMVISERACINREVSIGYYDGDDPYQIEKETIRIVDKSLKEPGVKKSIIFENSRRGAEKRSKDFVGQCHILHVHHGSVDKVWREKAEMDLATAKSSAVVIATCTLELGIDIGDLDIIQQEGSFPSVTSFVQRIGRTGRVNGCQRCAAYTENETEFLNNIAIVLLASTGYVESNELPSNLYHLLLQQLLIMALGANGVDLVEAKNALGRIAAIQGITENEWDDLVSYWIENGVLRLYERLILIGHEIEKRYAMMNYRDLFVLFSSPDEYEVRCGREVIGTLDRQFVMSRNKEFIFILAGRWWKVLELDNAKNVVFVKAIKTIPPPAKWNAYRPQNISFRISQKIKEILLSDDEYTDIRFRDQAERELASLRKGARYAGINPNPIQVFSAGTSILQISTYAGNRVNTYLAEYLKKKYGWEYDGLTYSHFNIRTDDSDHEMIIEKILLVVDESVRDGLLSSLKSIGEEIASIYDDPEMSKWSRWLPKKYRIRMLANQVFDYPSVMDWFKTLRSGIGKKGAAEAAPRNVL